MPAKTGKTKAKDKHIPDPAVKEVYRQMVDAAPGVQLKGATMPYTSVNGNMFSSMSKANRIGIRLSAADREIFMTTFNTGLHEAIPGFFQKEYVAVPETLYDDIETLRHWFLKSVEYANGLKPKPTTKKKK